MSLGQWVKTHGEPEMTLCLLEKQRYKQGSALGKQGTTQFELVETLDQQGMMRDQREATLFK
jgi:hypothetical protein